MLSFKIHFNHIALKDHGITPEEALLDISEVLKEHDISASDFEKGVFQADYGHDQVKACMAFIKLAKELDWLEDCVDDIEMIYQRYIYEKESLMPLFVKKYN